MVKRSTRLRLLLATIALYSLIYYVNNNTVQITRLPVQIQNPSNLKPTELPKEVNLINLEEDINENFTCIKTKRLLHIVKTTICLHDMRDAVSSIIRTDGIWEERLLLRLFGLLIRYPQMDFIDVGANVGAYTMFIASFGRTVISIECFKPNIKLIQKAVQIEKLQNKVILIGNAIFSESGKYLEIKSDPTNVGAQAIIAESNKNDSKDDMHAVKTMRFDAILPILKQRNIRNALMKVDIQWSESFLCETGSAVFDYVNIPVVLMEWDTTAPHFIHRIVKVLEFFVQRGYVPTMDICIRLDTTKALHSWPGDIFWVKMNQSKIC